MRSPYRGLLTFCSNSARLTVSCARRSVMRRQNLSLLLRSSCSSSMPSTPTIRTTGLPFCVIATRSSWASFTQVSRDAYSRPRIFIGFLPSFCAAACVESPGFCRVLRVLLLILRNRIRASRLTLRVRRTGHCVPSTRLFALLLSSVSRLRDLRTMRMDVSLFRYRMNPKAPTASPQGMKTIPI